MRHSGSLVALCIACAVVGAVAVLLASPGGVGSSRENSSAGLVDAVNHLARQVAALERRIDELRPAPMLAPPPRPSAAKQAGDSAQPPDRPLRPAARNPAAAPSSAEDDVLIRRSASDPPLPPMNRERVEEVGRWVEDEDLRKRWLLATEGSVLGWFGAPDKIWIVSGGGERWEYRRAILRGRARHLSIYFHRGRVLRMNP